MDSLVFAGSIVDLRATLETALRDRDDTLGDLSERPVPENGLHAVVPDELPRIVDLVEAPRGHQRFGFVQRSVVIEKARPQSRKRAGQVNGLHVRAANLDGLLEAYLGKQRVEVKLP